VQENYLPDLWVHLSAIWKTPVALSTRPRDAGHDALIHTAIHR
jgi:hypothetical protein